MPKAKSKAQPSVKTSADVRVALSALIICSIFLLPVFGASIVAGIVRMADMSGTISYLACTDSDSATSDPLAVAGSVTYTYRSVINGVDSGNVTTSTADICISDVLLAERTCNTNKSSGFKIVDCSATQRKCVSGACVAGLVGYWSFDEGQGSVVSNTAPGAKTSGSQVVYGGNFPSGSTNTPPWTATAVKGSALTFTGFRSFAHLANNLNDVFNNQISISYWIYLNKLPSEMTEMGTKPIVYPTVFDKYTVKADGYSRSTTSYQQYFGNASSSRKDKLVAKWIDTNNVAHDGFASDNVFKAKQWYHVVWVFDGSVSQTSQLYVNGVANAVTSPTNGLQINAINGTLDLSSFGNSLDGGIIDEVKVYNKALTATQVQDIYNSNNCGVLDPLSVDAMNWCGSKNDGSNTEKLNCVKNSCKAKFGASPALAAFCSSDKRISFNPNDALDKINTNCYGKPTSSDCLTAASYILGQRKDWVSQYCDQKYGAFTMQTQDCKWQARIMYHPANVYEAGWNYIVSKQSASGGSKASAPAPAVALAAPLVRYLRQTPGHSADTAFNNFIDSTVESDYFSNQPDPTLAIKDYNYWGESGLCIETHIGFPACPFSYSRQTTRDDCGDYPDMYKRMFCGEGEDCCGMAMAGGVGVNMGILSSVTGIPTTAEKNASFCPCFLSGLACSSLSRPAVCKTCYTLPDCPATGMCTMNQSGLPPISGTKDFVEKVARMLHKADSDSSDGCNPLPNGCTYTGSSYRPGDASGPHKAGQAMDFCCMGGTPSGNSCNIPSSDAMIGIVSGLNVTRECTAKERGPAPCGQTSGCNGGSLVHVDSISHGAGQPVEGCVYKDCDYSTCSSK